MDMDQPSCSKLHQFNTSPTTTGKIESHGQAKIHLARIRTIMKATNANDLQVYQESVFVIAKATEMFIQYLSKNTFMNIQNNSLLIDYRVLSKFVSDEKKLNFLLPIVPQKITVKEFKNIIDLNSSSSDCSSLDSSSSEDNAEK